MTIQDYLDLVTSEYAQQPNFIAVLTALLSVPVRVQDLMISMIPIFDLDTPPVGNQLDIIGQWVGASRNVIIPIAGVFFTWDGTNLEGWDYGTWQPAGSPTTITSLPDDAYLTLIKAKIAANNWDGTTDGAYIIWNALFEGTGVTILIQDYQNMSYAMIFVGGIISSLVLALITGGYIPLRPEGIEITEYFIGVGDNPVFGWDLNTTYVKGWDIGYWATELAPT